MFFDANANTDDNVVGNCAKTIIVSPDKGEA